MVEGCGVAPGQDDVELDAGYGSPVEFKGGADGVYFDGRAVGGAEDVELIMAVVDRNGVVGLKWRSGLGEEASGSEDTKKK
jgi:hypothetical protein